MGRPGHIAPCVTGGPIPCPVCNTQGTAQENTLMASVYVHQAIHKFANREFARKLWEAKKLIDEVINEDMGR